MLLCPSEAALEKVENMNKPRARVSSFLDIFEDSAFLHFGARHALLFLVSHSPLIDRGVCQPRVSITSCGDTDSAR